MQGMGAASPTRASRLFVHGRFGGVGVSTDPTRQSGAELITAERQRQITEEGWTPQHDLRHSRGQLARAAFCYALLPQIRPDNGEPPDSWPWDLQYWKPTPDDHVRELVKAGALYRAEADRLILDGAWFAEELVEALEAMQECATSIDRRRPFGVVR